MGMELANSSSLGRWLTALAGVLILSLAVVAFACDDDDDNGGGDEPTAAMTEPAGDESAAVEAAMQAAVDAWNGRDLEGFLSSFTDAGLMATFEASREEAQVFLADFIGEPPITLGDVTVTIDGATATAEAAQFAFGVFLDPTTFTLVEQDGAWLFENEEHVAAEVPEGTTAVDVSLLEYQFSYDESAIASGDIAFVADNIGGEAHEIALVSLDGALDLEAALAGFAEGVPEGIEVLGVGGPWEPGDGQNLVLSEPLAAGRYAMLCFIESADGTPHAFLGMTSEFTVE